MSANPEAATLRRAAEWIIRTGYPHDWRTTEHPPPDVWEILVEAAHSDPDGSLHGNSLSREEIDALMRLEADRPDDE